MDDEDGTIVNAYNESQNMTGPRPLSSNMGKVIDDMDGVLISVETSVDAEQEGNQIMSSIRSRGTLSKSRSRQHNATNSNKHYPMQ